MLRRIVLLISLALSFALGRDEKTKTLFVLAHPDDETLFMVRNSDWMDEADANHSGIHSNKRIVLLLLHKWQSMHSVYTLGNANGQGERREEELRQWMQHVNVSEDHYTILQEERIQDGFDQSWNPVLCSQILREVIQKEEIREVYSFDEKGVSKHPNHIATFRALEFLSRYPDLENVSFYSLESGSLLTKYMGPLNLIRKQSSCIYNSNPLLSLNTFRIHQSQITWYRILFTLFSRFTYMNCWKTTVVPLHDKDVPLDVHE